ncbi:magnesium transporter [Catenovulum adriaticum]|uniref:Magnesium transporter MgtE n=1 Tax=Catenovulum adriaticum TaxID=2984846 RepID=A0ABY7AN00_9ALTE|nr:magnesium transporter [Catenovulum sp. TS8]WAJ70521.1 magnesium transporter [Catenovulum sp. TS8]
MPEAYEHSLSNQTLLELTAALNRGMFVHVRNALHNMPAVDVAFILESTPVKTRFAFWQLIDSEFHGEILEELSEDVRTSIVRQMMPEAVAEATEGMDTDDLAQVLRSLPDELYQEVLNSLDHQDRHRAEAALAYEEFTAGSVMNTDTVTIRPDVTVEVVLRYLRMRAELPKNTDSLYVVDQDDILIGEVSLNQLVTSRPDLLIAQLMNTEVNPIAATMPETEAAQQFERYNWVSAAVVDEQNHLLGRITIDDMVDIIREDAEHSMMSMAGLDDEEDTFAPVVQSTKKRSIWLGVNLLTALLAATVSNFFEDILSQLAVLAILNTIVPSMGGVAGNQTLTLVIRAMALGQVLPTNTRSLLLKELTIGFLNGIIWAVLIAGIVGVWKQDITLAAVIAFAMLMNMLAAGIAGVTIPLLLKKFNIDPALAGSVILTTVTDIIGIFAFLGSAALLLS